MSESLLNIKTMNTESHYRNHLANFYSWMFGDFKEMVVRQLDLFKSFSIQPASSKVAIDLGSGSGFQSIALIQLGFEVHAVDFSEALIAELRSHEPKVLARVGDINDLAFAENLKPELIVCMGDTVTHLSSKDEVSKLVKDSYRLLEKEGKLIFTFRDLTNHRDDLERFIPVRSDENRILTCFLEDAGEQVKVFDLFYEKENGKWNFKKSSYLKVKLSSQWLKAEMENFGFSVKQNELPSGLQILIGKKNLT